MQIRKLVGLENLLQSLSLDEQPGKTHHVVYPWSQYSKVPGQDLGFWYSAERCQYDTLRRLILQEFRRIGHPSSDRLADALTVWQGRSSKLLIDRPSSDRLADALVLAFTLMPKTKDVLTEFERVLNSFVTADVSQFILIPALAVIRYVKVGEPDEHELIGCFGHGPFCYEPLDRDLMEKIKHTLERNGLGCLLPIPEMDKLFGSIAVYREPKSTKIIDFTGLGFTGRQPPETVKLMQYYFDDLSAMLFEDFWQEHLESQYISVAAGAALLDRASLEALPGTAWLSVFSGFDFLGAKGIISLIKEESDRRNLLAWRVHFLGAGLPEAKHRMDLELTEQLGPGPHRSYPSLLNFARLVTRSRELETRGYLDESFTLLMVAMESLLAERELIETTLSRRAGALLAVSEDKHFEDSVKLVRKLYKARSDFVHEGKPITPDSLKTLQEVCQIVFFATYRSQARFTEPDGDENKWKGKWLTVLDYISACFDAGVVVDSRAASISGALKNQAAPNV